jgi:hypothetical protein
MEDPMTGNPATATPLPRGVAESIVAPHLAMLAEVLTCAWDAYQTARQAARTQVAQFGPAARGMVVADLMREPVARLFITVPLAQVDIRFGRPWVNLAGGAVQIRFKKLNTTLGICHSDSERQARLAFHLGDPLLPDMPEATILTAGYVLDASETQIDRLVLVCHVGDQLLYSFDLPGAQSGAKVPTQLALTPLSDPLIRSSRTAARRRLDEGGVSK